MKKILITIAIAALAHTTSASSEIRINGFSNITTSVVNNESGMFGYDDDVDFANESLFALQFSADINDKVTATSQIIARGSENYSPEFEWAYLTYKLTEQTSFTAGRFRLPLFRYSDSSDVGYSYHWINAPISVYKVPFNNVDGLRIDFRNHFGRFEYSSQLAFGRIRNKYDILGESSDIDAKNVVLANLNMQYNEWNVRLVAARTDTTFSVNAINNAIAPIKGLSPDLFSDISFKDDLGTFFGIGLEYDVSDWFIGGEVTKIRAENSFYPEELSYYVTAGLRMGKWTPSVTVEGKDSTNDIKFTEKAQSLPAPVSDAITGLLVAVQAPFAQEYVATGIAVRYDLDAGISLKADVVRMSDKINEDLDNTLFRASINYVF